MAYEVRIDQKFFLWGSAIFDGGYELGCSADQDDAERIRALIEIDEDLAEQDFERPPQTDASGLMRVCYALRLPHPFSSFMRRHVLTSVEHLVAAMRSEPDVEVTFGHLSERNYVHLLGMLAKRTPRRGESCIVLNAQLHYTIYLSVHKPPMLIRVSGLPTDGNRPDAA